MQKIKTIFKKMQCFFRDYYYLLFKSAEENHLRIQRLKKGSSISAGEKSQEIKISLKPFFTKREKIKNGSSSFIVDSVTKQQLESRGGGSPKEDCLLKFNSLMHLKRYQKRLRIITSSSSFTVLLVLILVIGFQFFGAFSKSATFGWIQSTWSGGADMVNFPNHTSNQTNWTKYYSKDETVSAGDTVSLSTSSGTATQTTDADFNAWTKTNGYVETGTGSITQLKAPGATCAEAAECASGICTSSVCRGKWLSGACSGIYVYATDLSTMYTWGPSSSCASPQCDATETYSGTAYNRLSFLNTVSYTDYPARNACKTVGGRLPTIAELSCIYTNRASYGNNFQTTRGYWSSTENAAGHAWNVNFGNGGVRFDPKNNKAYFIGYVRCVR